MSYDVFIIAAARAGAATTAIRQALDLAGIPVTRVQDTVFGLDVSAAPELPSIMRAAGLECPFATVAPPLRALSFGCASILSDDAGPVLVAGMDGTDCTAFVLASPEQVGMLNLLPRGRVAARARTAEGALRLGGLSISDIQLQQQGSSLGVVLDLLDALDAQVARWALLSSPDLHILVERL